jgi:hypothetical protein
LKQFIYKINAISHKNLDTCLTTSASGRALLGSRGGRGGGGQSAGSSRLGLDRRDLALSLGLLGGSVPVEDHLESKDGVESEAGNETVEDELVVNLLEGCEDSGKRAGKVVEDLEIVSYCLQMGQVKVTYSKSAELTGATLLENGENLGNLASNAQDTSTSLEMAQGLRINNVLCEQGSSGSSKTGDKDGSQTGASAVVENKNRDNNVLSNDQGSLAKGAEREAISDVVGERDEVGCRLEDVGEEGHAFGGLGTEKLLDLGNLDDGRCGDDSNTESLGNTELDAVDILNVDVEKKRLVASLADERNAQIANWRGEVMRDGCNSRLDGIDGWFKGVHYGLIFLSFRCKDGD